MHRSYTTTMSFDRRQLEAIAEWADRSGEDFCAEYHKPRLPTSMEVDEFIRTQVRATLPKATTAVKVTRIKIRSSRTE